MQKQFTDHLGNQINVNYPPKKIVSLVPSQTELLYDLGLHKEVVGVTKFCIHPAAKVKDAQKIGGTKKLNIDAIIALAPDLIIANKEENTIADITQLQQCFPVWVSDVNSFEDAVQTITEIGALVDRVPEAAYVNHLISAGFRDLQQLAVEKKIAVKVAYLIWQDPYMAAGNKTFINDILTKVGFINVVKQNRYPTLKAEDIAAANPQYILLSSEPFPFNTTHAAQLAQQINGVKVLVVDGEMFSWYGTRLIKAVQYFFELQNNFAENE